MLQNSISNAKSVTVSGIYSPWYLNTFKRVVGGGEWKGAFVDSFLQIILPWFFFAITLFFKMLSSYLRRVQKKKIGMLR